MDVQRLIWIALMAFIAVGCSKVANKSTVYPKVTNGCEDQALHGRHLVRFHGGRVEMIRGGSREDFINEYVSAHLQEIEYVEPDFRISLPEFSANLHSSSAGTLEMPAADNWGVVAIHADGAWAKGARGGGITVAVVDSGMDMGHPQLRDQLAYNSGETGNDASGRDKATNGIDDDDNGLVDDSAGYDFTSDSPQPFDANSHGTHVSGIIAAAHQDSVAEPHDYVQGIAPEAKLLPLEFIDSSGSGSLFNAMRAIDYAVSRGARVVNASWGGSGCSKLLHDQIAGLVDKGVVFVAAAGNSDLNIDLTAEYPAAYNLAAQLTIGATGIFGFRAQFSNYGDRAVHLFAPGVDIVSTLPGNRIGPMSGTSMATPIVAGAVAALLSLRPQASMDQLRQVLYSSAHKESSYRNASHGLIDLSAASNELARLIP